MLLSHPLRSRAAPSRRWRVRFLPSALRPLHPSRLHRLLNHRQQLRNPPPSRVLLSHPLRSRAAPSRRWRVRFLHSALRRLHPSRLHRLLNHRQQLRNPPPSRVLLRHPLRSRAAPSRRSRVRFPHSILLRLPLSRLRQARLSREFQPKRHLRKLRWHRHFQALQRPLKSNTRWGRRHFKRRLASLSRVNLPFRRRLHWFPNPPKVKGCRNKKRSGWGCRRSLKVTRWRNWDLTR